MLENETANRFMTEERLVKKMIAKTWMALALGSVLLIGGVSAVSALGAMNGTCDQDKLQLKDGTGDNCIDPVSLPSEGLPTEETSEDSASEVDDSSDCNETEECVLYDYLYTWDFLYNETDLEPPYQSACGQE